MSTIERTEPEEVVPTATRGSTAIPSSRSWLVRLFREPLLHFLLLGAVLFIVFSYVQGDEATGEQEVLVSAGKVEHLAALFTRTWQRPPTANELRGLIDDYVREEVAYREGLSIGLDQNDTVIRRRIRQKLDFVAQDLASQLEPTEQELQAYLEDHADEFRVDPRLSFRQVFFDPEKHGDDLDQIISDVVVTLQEDSSVDPREQGDRTLLEFGYEDVSTTEVTSLLGRNFGEALFELEPGTWHGPVRSAYGMHAVIVDDYKPGEQPPLKQVRAEVRREWEHERHQQLTEAFYQNLISEYEITIDWPEQAIKEAE